MHALTFESSFCHSSLATCAYVPSAFDLLIFPPEISTPGTLQKPGLCASGHTSTHGNSCCQWIPWSVPLHSVTTHSSFHIHRCEPNQVAPWTACHHQLGIGFDDTFPPHMTRRIRLFSTHCSQTINQLILGQLLQILCSQVPKCRCQTSSFCLLTSVLS